jgi:RNA polymerase sigma-70 factor (ECF subfamily)
MVKSSSSLPAEVVEALVANHRAFLSFLERRVGSRDLAEEILQEAFVRGIARGGSLRDKESGTAWFYRLLRNALADHFRRRGAEKRALTRLKGEVGPGEPAADQELMGTVCACVLSLLDTLKPEYAAALRRVDLDGVAVSAFAKEAALTPNNARVRLHRARGALREQLLRCCGTCATHGCLDCECGQPGGSLRV